MENNSYSDSKENGKKVWKTLQNQWGEVLGFFGSMINSIVCYFKKNFVAALILAILFGAIGFAISYLQKPSYHAEMTVSYAHLEKKIYADMLYKLDQLIQNKQYVELADVLDLSLEEAKNLKNIDSKNIHYQPLIKDISTEKVPFYIIVDVYDNSILDTLEKKLIAFLSSSEFVQERLKLNASNFEKEAAYLKSQIDFAEKLKAQTLQIIDLDPEMLEKLEQINNQQYANFKQLRDIESAMQFNQNIELLDGFVAHSPSPINRHIKYMLLGIIAGILLRMIWPVFKK